MNVVKTIVSGNSEPINQVSRQDKDSSSKRGGSGFSDTLGSLDKAASPAQGSATGSRNSSATEQPASNADDVTEAPVDTGQSAIAKAIVPPTIFLDTATVPLPEPLKAAALPVDADIAKGMKEFDVLPKNVSPLPDFENEVVILPALSDLAKLVSALSKATASAPASETDVTVDSGEDDGDADTDVVPTDGLNENMDILSLLASTVMPVSQSPMQAPTKQNAGAALGGVSVAASDDQLAGAGTPTSTVVRLQKQDVPALDLHIDTNEDGSMNVDVSTASGDVANVVQVVDSRRFIGLAAPSNAAAISTVMAADPEWASAMAGQTTNSPMISSTGEVVHVLKIQMSPVDLGHVTAALKLVGDSLSVQLTAHTLKGYSELQKDTSDIMDALKSQGFTVDQVTVTLASNTERQDSGTNNRQPSEPGQQGAQQGQRGHEEKPQGQFYRQPGASISEEAISRESTLQSEIPARTTSARPDHVYL